MHQEHDYFSSCMYILALKEWIKMHWDQVNFYQQNLQILYAKDLKDQLLQTDD